MHTSSLQELKGSGERFEGAKTLLVTAYLPDKFWGHAFLTMVYIRNRTWPARANGIPWQLITKAP